MTPPSRAKPVSAFAPELLSLLLEGGRRKVCLSMPWRSAVTLRGRLYALRHQMRLAKHSMHALSARATVRIELPDGTAHRRYKSGNVIPIDKSIPCTLIVEPSDADFATIIRAAGIDPTLGQLEPILEQPESKATASTSAPESLDSYMERMISGLPEGKL